MGLFYLISGIILNIDMIITKSWPTYIFSIICIIGVLFLILGFIMKKISWVIQIAISTIFLLIFLYLLFS